MTVRLLYLTPGCFDKGGISRYTRYQIRAWREICGEANVRVLSLLGPDVHSIEEPFAADWSGGGVLPSMKTAMSARAIGMALTHPGQIVHVGHMNLSSVGKVAAMLTRGLLFVNVYGLEVWSHPRWHSLWGVRSADCVISDCHWTMRYINEQGIRRTGGDCVFWDCVDVTKFFPAPAAPDVVARYGIPDPTANFNVLTLGRLTRAAAHKGFERLLAMFAGIVHRVPRMRLIFAGRGDLIEDLKKRAAFAGVADRVVFTGTVHERDLPDVYRAAHVFSLISDQGPGRGEGIPLTPLEAAACGVPILVGNQDGSQEAVVEGVNGHVLEPFDLSAHAAAILGLLGNPERCAAMGRAAAERIRREFSYSVFVAKHRALLASMQSRVAHA